MKSFLSDSANGGYLYFLLASVTALVLALFVALNRRWGQITEKRFNTLVFHFCWAVGIAYFVRWAANSMAMIRANAIEIEGVFTITIFNSFLWANLLYLLIGLSLGWISVKYRNHDFSTREISRKSILRHFRSGFVWKTFFYLAGFYLALYSFRLLFFPAEDILGQISVIAIAALIAIVINGIRNNQKSWWLGSVFLALIILTSSVYSLTRHTNVLDSFNANDHWENSAIIVASFESQEAVDSLIASALFLNKNNRLKELGRALLARDRLKWIDRIPEPVDRKTAFSGVVQAISYRHKDSEFAKIWDYIRGRNERITDEENVTTLLKKLEANPNSRGDAVRLVHASLEGFLHKNSTGSGLSSDERQSAEKIIYQTMDSYGTLGADCVHVALKTANDLELDLGRKEFFSEALIAVASLRDVDSIGEVARLANGDTARIADLGEAAAKLSLLREVWEKWPESLRNSPELSPWLLKGAIRHGMSQGKSNPVMFDVISIMNSDSAVASPAFEGVLIDLLKLSTHEASSVAEADPLETEEGKLLDAWTSIIELGNRYLGENQLPFFEAAAEFGTTLELRDALLSAIGKRSQKPITFYPGILKRITLGIIADFDHDGIAAQNVDNFLENHDPSLANRIASEMVFALTCLVNQEEFIDPDVLLDGRMKKFQSELLHDIQSEKSAQLDFIQRSITIIKQLLDSESKIAGETRESDDSQGIQYLVNRKDLFEYFNTVALLLSSLDTFSNQTVYEMRNTVRSSLVNLIPRSFERIPGGNARFLRDGMKLARLVRAPDLYEALLLRWVSPNGTKLLEGLVEEAREVDQLDAECFYILRSLIHRKFANRPLEKATALVALWKSGERASDFFFGSPERKSSLSNSVKKECIEQLRKVVNQVNLKKGAFDSREAKLLNRVMEVAITLNSESLVEELRSYTAIDSHDGRPHSPKIKRPKYNWDSSVPCQIDNLIGFLAVGHDFKNSLEMNMIWISETTEWRGYWISDCEVSNSNYDSVIKSKQMQRDLHPNFPVTNLTLEQACEFCFRLNNRERNHMPDGYAYSIVSWKQWNQVNVKDHGEISERVSDQIGPVGTSIPNLLGIFDLKGNAGEIIDRRGVGDKYYILMRDGKRADASIWDDGRKAPDIGFRIVLGPSLWTSQIDR